MILGTELFLVHLVHVQNVCIMTMTKKYNNLIYGIFLAALACFCNPCYTAMLTDRVGDNMLTCFINPCVLMGIRTKVRATYKIQVSYL